MIKKKKYYAYEFVFKQPEIYRDIFIAILSAMDFEGFVETKDGLLAYSDKRMDIEETLNFPIPYDLIIKEINPKNWNKQWEKQIQPLVIDEKVYIKTSFHSEKNYPYTIHIDPKMSFGTGHHETTELMIKQMLQMDFKNKTVIDVGAGTGVLSILSELLGASEVYALDIDQWAYENMKENFEKNPTSKCVAYWGDTDLFEKLPRADILLANINLNVLLADFSKYHKQLKKNGKLLLSGFLEKDIQTLISIAENNGMIFENLMSKNEWQSILFSKIV